METRQHTLSAAGLLRRASTMRSSMSDGRADDIAVSATGLDAGSHDSLVTLPMTSPIWRKETFSGYILQLPDYCMLP